MSFQITHRSFGPFAEIRVEHLATGAFFTVVPGHGAVVRQLVLAARGRAVSLLHTPATPPALAADDTYASALLFPFPSRIPGGRYTFDGTAYQLPPNERARGNAIHGFVAARPFEVLAQTTGPDAAALTLRHRYAGDYPGYPFPFDLQVTYRLTDAGVFSVQYAAQNTGTRACPVAFGWHPYFCLDGAPVDDLTLGLAVASEVRLNDQLLPVGEGPPPTENPLPLRGRHLDAAFVVGAAGGGVSTTLRSEARDLTLRVWQETGPQQFTHLVVFTHPARDRIAIEPLTAGVDAFNNGRGLRVLPPNETAGGEIRVSLT